MARGWKYLKLQAKFTLAVGAGVLALAVSTLAVLDYFQFSNLEQKLRSFSENELNSLHALVDSAMKERLHDPQNVAIKVFNGWFESRNKDYPGKLWSVWGPKVTAYMAQTDSEHEARKPLDAIDEEVLRTGQPLGRFVDDTYRYSVPIVLDHNAAHQACVGCHQGAMGINDGEVIAVFSSSLSTTEDFVVLRNQRLFTSLGGLAGLLLMILITWSIFGRLVARPISKIATVLSGLASDQVVDVPNVNRNDEVGEIAKATEAFKETKAFLAMVVENVPAPITVRDFKTGQYVLVNRATEVLMGCSRRDLIGKTPSDIYEPDQMKQIDEQMRKIASTKMPQFFDEHVLETLAGKRIVTAHRLPVFGGDGEIRYLLTLMSDVTNRHLQTREIEEMKTFLDTVIENVPVSIIVRDARDLRCILANRAAEELHGISRDKIIGTIASNMYPGGVGAKIDESARAVLEGRKVIVIPEEKRVIAGKGERIIAATRVPVLGNNGEPRYLMTVAEDITERRQAQARIAHLAHHDSLTGLPNRAAFAEHFTAAVERARSEKIGLVVMCMDLDHFKEVNDVFGHAIGDALLCQASRALCDAAGESFVARLGGDEFALVSASAASPEAADHLAQALTAAVNREFDVEGHKLQIGLSVGVALFPNDGEDTGALFANADAALYRAKADGRGVIRFFEPSMDKKLRDQRALSLDLRHAVDHGELMLCFQPQARMDGTIIGFEALTRWHHPTLGYVPPSEFIQLAEGSGLILDLGEWVLRSACREAASWPNRLDVAVNVSAVQFRHGDLPALVHSILVDTGLSASRLELEVTESVLIDDLPRALSVLRRLKALGIRIAMDDFGTGYSSLSNLQSFSFDKIKIDRSFIMNLRMNPQSATIVRAIIGLGRGLEVPVLAEGVETAEQFAFLAKEACSEVQGYWIGKPLPIEDYAAIVGRQPPSKKAHRTAA